MKKIFISRNLANESPILSVSQDHILTDQSLIEFSALPFETPQADWVFFYSRNGVRYFFEGGNYALHPYLWACMSKGTGDELSHYVTDTAFIGSGNPQEVAKSFQTVIKEDQITCFVRAENSIDSVHTIMNRPNDFSIPVYKNIPSSTIPKDDFDILIFTSPLNAETWFAKNEYQGEALIAIGGTTASSLTELGMKNILIANSPSEISISKILQKLL